MDSRGKFGEHERDLIVALGGTTRNSSFSDNNNNNNRKGSQEIIIASSLSSGHRSLIAGARSDMTVMPKVSIFIKKLSYHHVLPHKIKRSQIALQCTILPDGVSKILIFFSFFFTKTEKKQQQNRTAKTKNNNNNNTDTLTKGRSEEGKQNM